MGRDGMSGWRGPMCTRGGGEEGGEGERGERGAGRGGGVGEVCVCVWEEGLACEWWWRGGVSVCDCMSVFGSVCMCKGVWLILVLLCLLSVRLRRYHFACTCVLDVEFVLASLRIYLY